MISICCRRGYLAIRIQEHPQNLRALDFLRSALLQKGVGPRLGAGVGPLKYPAEAREHFASLHCSSPLLSLSLCLCLSSLCPMAPSAVLLEQTSQSYLLSLFKSLFDAYSEEEELCV